MTSVLICVLALLVLNLSLKVSRIERILKEEKE